MTNIVAQNICIALSPPYTHNQITYTAITSSPLEGFFGTASQHNNYIQTFFKYTYYKHVTIIVFPYLCCKN